MNFKINLSIAILMFFINFFLNAQKYNSFGLVNKPLRDYKEGAISIGGSDNQTRYPDDELDDNNEKFVRANKVYERLVEARGDKRFLQPEFFIASSEQNGSFLTDDGLRIGLEEKTYDLCMELGEEEGENAIAAILGHELTHYYEKHQWRMRFMNEFAELVVAQRFMEGDVLHRIESEAQADYLGNFLAYSAGFQIFEGLPDFYDRLYQAYELEDTLEGYPNKADRKKLAILTLDKTKELVDVFEVGNLLIAIGRYDDALNFYKHILIQYQGREVYNNLGILTILSALKYFTSKELKYKIPIQLDYRIGFNAFNKINLEAYSTDDYLDSATISGNSEKRIALLKEAIVYFDNAISMDTEYAPSYLNKACAYYLVGGKENISRAKLYAEIETKEKVLNNSKFKKTLSDAIILLALLTEIEGNTDKAINMLESLNKTSALANYNLAVMNRKVSSRTVRFPEKVNLRIEGIKQNDIFKFATVRQYKEQRLYGQIKLRVFKNVEGLKYSTIFYYRPQSGLNMPEVFFHITNTNYSSPPEDIFKVGVSREAITKKIGEPHSSLELTNGEIMVYNQTIFIMDKNQQLKQYGNYLVNTAKL